MPRVVGGAKHGGILTIGQVANYIAQLRRSCMLFGPSLLEPAPEVGDRDVMGLHPGLDTVGDKRLGACLEEFQYLGPPRARTSLGMSSAAILKPYSYSSPNIGGGSRSWAWKVRPSTPPETVMCSASRCHSVTVGIRSSPRGRQFGPSLCHGFWC